MLDSKNINLLNLYLYNFFIICMKMYHPYVKKHDKLICNLYYNDEELYDIYMI